MVRFLFAALSLLAATVLAAAPAQGVNLGVPQPLFPANNWWNIDISAAPVDTSSAAYISFIGPTRAMHPDFGGDAGDGDVYGFPVIVVDGWQPKKTVEFVWWPEQSDGVDHTTETSIPFYPVPDEAISQTGWVEGGQPGSIDQRDDGDRHILIVDQTNNRLYELYSVWFNGTQWEAGSGAHFYMNRNDRRPEEWTSADAAGLAILPGLVRYEEVAGPDEIRHAFRVTVRATNGYVWPASHEAGSTTGALPMGARLRLKASKDISGYSPEVQRIFRAMKKYGLIVADNGSDMYVSGSYDTRWNNDILNPAFRGIKASDFEVIQLGWKPATLVATFPRQVQASRAANLVVTAYDANGNVATGYRGTVQFTSTDGAATLPASYTFTAADAGVHRFPAAVTLRTPGSHVLTMKDAAAATITGSAGVRVFSTLHEVSTGVVWKVYPYATKALADAKMASVNLNATLVATGYGDYPYVVVERSECGSCAPVSVLFTATPMVAGMTAGPNDKVVLGSDGTTLLVRRITAPAPLMPLVNDQGPAAGAASPGPR